MSGQVEKVVTGETWIYVLRKGSCALQVYGCDVFEERRHSDVITGITYIGNGWIATCSRDGTAIVWKPDGSIGRVLNANRGPVDDILYLGDGRLTSIYASNHVCIWTLFAKSYEEFVSTPIDRMFLHDGKMFLVTEGVANIYMGSMLTCIYTLKRPKALTVAQSCDDYIAYGYDDGQVKLVSPHSTRTLSCGNRVTAILQIPDGRLTVGLVDGTVLVWRNGKRTTKLKFGAPIASLAFSHDSELLVCYNNCVVPVRFLD